MLTLLDKDDTLVSSANLRPSDIGRLWRDQILVSLYGETRGLSGIVLLWSAS